MEARDLFFSCEVVRTLRTIVPHACQVAPATVTLDEFAEDYLRSVLESENDFRSEPDVTAFSIAWMAEHR